MDEPPPAQAPGARETRAGAETPIFAIGEILSDQYEIVGLLGSGGMGQVFEAHDRLLNRKVAIKAAWVGLEGPGLRKEAQALAAIHHPALVTVHGLGRHRGIEFLVMERVYGVRLADHLRQRAVEGGQFTINEVIDVLIALTDGLAVVHRAGLAHRDVTPGNIMLGPDNRVVLMDFGVSLPEFAVASESLLSGTPQYMAPETVRNRIAEGAGHMVDLYALGVIGYELLTGTVPFDGASILEVLTRHVADPVPDLAARRPDAPPRLVSLLRELLAKDPADRPQTMDAVRWQLRSILRREESARTTLGGVLSLMIVDDDPEFAEYTGLLVKQILPDADVTIEGNAEIAIKLVRRRPPHVLLLDLEMAPMNGIEVCMFLRGTRAADACTIALVSGKAHPEDLQLLQALGVKHFIPKGPELGDGIAALLREVRAAR